MSASTVPAAAEVPAREETPLKRLAIDFAQSRLAVLGLVTMLLIALIAITAPLIAPQDPYDLAQLDIMDGRMEPGTTGGTGIRFWPRPPTTRARHALRIMYGLRISSSSASAPPSSPGSSAPPSASSPPTWADAPRPSSCASSTSSSASPASSSPS